MPPLIFVGVTFLSNFFWCTILELSAFLFPLLSTFFQSSKIVTSVVSIVVSGKSLVALPSLVVLSSLGGDGGSNCSISPFFVPLDLVCMGGGGGIFFWLVGGCRW